MAIRTILLLAHDDGGQPARYQAAVDIVRALDGHLICLDVVALPTPVVDYVSRTGAAVALAGEIEREALNRDRLDRRLHEAAIPFDWIERDGSIAGCLVDAAALADLIILNAGTDPAAAPDMTAIVGAVVTRSGRPVLAMPPHQIGFHPHGRAMIAWDGSPPAANALRASIGLLQHAAAVRIVTIDDGSVAIDPEDAATYLSRAGVHAEVRRIRDRSHPPERLLHFECGQWHADYCVMGAYSRNRLSEAVLGGVTRALLAGSAFPLILAH
jgi:nucleotide-binding universal stress UspA family protein